MFLHEHHRRRKRGWFRWVSHIYSFAVCVTNFVAASFHVKEQEWLDMFRQFVWVVERVILFCRCYKFYLSMLLSVQVSLVKMPPKRTIESFYCFIKAKLSTYWKWNCCGWRGSWGADKNEISNYFIISAPNFYFAAALNIETIRINVTQTKHNSK